MTKGNFKNAYRRARLNQFAALATNGTPRPIYDFLIRTAPYFPGRQANYRSTDQLATPRAYSAPRAIAGPKGKLP